MRGRLCLSSAFCFGCLRCSALAKSVPHLQLSASRKKATLKQAGAAANFSPPRLLGSSNAPAPQRGRAACLAQASSEGPRSARPSADWRPDWLCAAREKICAACPAGDLLISDSVQLPATSASASASSRASLLQEVHIVHQERVSDHERQGHRRQKSERLFGSTNKGNPM